LFAEKILHAKRSMQIIELRYLRYSFNDFAIKNLVVVVAIKNLMVVVGGGGDPFRGMGAWRNSTFHCNVALQCCIAMNQKLRKFYCNDFDHCKKNDFLAQWLCNSLKCFSAV